MNDLQIKYVPVGSLKEFPMNPRKNDEAAEQLARLMGEYGFVIPIIATPDGTIRAGHTRIKAARKQGMKEVPVIFVDFGDEKKAVAFSLADNKSHEWSEWDFPKLKDIMVEIDDGSFDMALTGFKEDELKEIFGHNGDPPADAEPQVDRAEETNKRWQVKTGDLWQIGEHRLLCGDCTKREDAQRVMGGKKAQLCFTDPPYGADIQYATHNDTQDALEGLIAGFFPIARDMCDVVALTPGINNVFLYPKPSWLLCWFYAAGTGRSPWGFTAWQPVAVWGSDPKLAAGEGCHPDGFQWMMDKQDAEINQNTGHACPKPTSVWTRFLERLTNKKSVNIYDPFLGSGTTMVACENLKRKCRAIEISPAYCAVSLQRMADAFPGIKIKRLGNGTEPNN
jgi:hypothetical protein